MANDYGKMTADLIARMSRSREHTLCCSGQARISAVGASDIEAQCARCSADDACDDIELDAVTRPLLKPAREVACD
jgi:hypothetical protein